MPPHNNSSIQSLRRFALLSLSLSLRTLALVHVLALSLLLPLPVLALVLPRRLEVGTELWLTCFRVAFGPNILPQNAFRDAGAPRTPNAPEFDPEEDDPTLVPEWDQHLRLVYELFDKFLESPAAKRPEVPRMYVTDSSS
jgi:hypothetical protein